LPAGTGVKRIGFIDPSVRGPELPFTDGELAEMEGWAREEKHGNLGQQARARNTLKLIAEVRRLRELVPPCPVCGSRVADIGAADDGVRYEHGDATTCEGPRT
jgi:hypothetical protein